MVYQPSVRSLLLLSGILIFVLLIWVYITTSFNNQEKYNEDVSASMSYSNYRENGMKMYTPGNHLGKQDILSSEKPSNNVHSSFSTIPMTFKTLNRNYKSLLESMNNRKAGQEDPHLIEIIQKYFIFPPSSKTYNLDNPNRMEYSNGQTPFVDSRLNFIESGFYVECGALNGEKGSNTLFFEKVRKWNGLLIEADPSNFQQLQSKNRKAFIMNACLNPYPYPSKVQFNKAFNRGRVLHNEESLRWIKNENIKLQSVSMQCFPFYSILLALNQTRVDFFSLDIEGDELNVLKTIPWDKVDIRMLAVEYVHETGKQQNLQRYMESVGYDTLLKMQRDDGGVNDLIFRKKGLSH